MRRILLVAVLWCLATGAQAASTIVPGLLPVGIPPNSGLINQNFQNAANDINALQNLNAGVTAPSNPSLGYFWLSTPQNATTYPLNLWDGTRWANVASLDSVNHIWMPPIGGGVPPTILSATTTDLGSVPQAFVYVSGTNPIQSFGASAPIGTIKVVDFLATTTLTSNPSLLILPGSVNLTTAPGDTLLAAQIAAGQWALISYNRAAGGTIVQPVIGTPPTVVGDCAAWATTNATLLSDTGHPCGSSGGSVVGPSMSTIGHCALWANTTGTLLSDVVCPGLITAATNTALRAISTATTSYVMRLGVNAAGDAPAQVFQALASPCTINSGVGDVGWQAGSADGKCWVAIFDNPGGVDLREWGNVGTANDTTVWSTIDASMGNSGWPTQEPKTVIVPAITTPASIAISNIQRITGTPHISTLTCTATQGSSGYCWLYQGNGPFQLDNLVVGCQTYEAATGSGHIISPANCGGVTFGVLPANSTSYPSKFVARNIDIIGGVEGFHVAQASAVDMEIDKAYDVYIDPVVVSMQNDPITGNLNGGGNLTPIQNARVIIKDCISPGQYCLSYPVTFPPSDSTYTGTWRAPTDMYFDVRCIGAGLIGGKGCVDATGSAVDHFHGKLVAYNSETGFESKPAGNIGGALSPTVGAVPAVFNDRYFDADIVENFDARNCVDFPYEISYYPPTGSPITPQNLSGHIVCDYSPAGPFVPNFYYNKGEVFNVSGVGYIVLVPGVSGATPPTGGVVGDSDNNIVVNGTMSVQCACWGTPATATQLQALDLEEINGGDFDITTHGAAYGIIVFTRGETNTLTNVNIKLHGYAGQLCYDDSPVNGNLNPNNGSVINMTLDGSCVVENTNTCQPTAIEMGNANTSGAVVNYTNFTLRGEWSSPNVGVGAGCTEAIGLRTNAGSVQGQIMGAHIYGYTNALYLNGPVSLTMVGGILQNTGGNDGVIRGSAISSGTFSAQPSVAVLNSDAAGAPDWIMSVGSTLVFAGQFVDPPSSASPTAHCNIGQIAAKIATAGLWGCTAVNTWGSLY